MAQFCCGPLVYFILFCTLLFSQLDCFGFTSSLCMHHGTVTSLSCVLFARMLMCRHYVCHFLRYLVSLVVSGLLCLSVAHLRLVE